jgi:predicted RNA binding protein YcfA (HicA-like mRNA interferase family)
MHPLAAKEVIGILLANGFVLRRTRGSHHIFWNAATGVPCTRPTSWVEQAHLHRDILGDHQAVKIAEEKFMK